MSPPFASPNRWAFRRSSRTFAQSAFKARWMNICLSPWEARKSPCLRLRARSERWRTPAAMCRRRASRWLVEQVGEQTGRTIRRQNTEATRVFSAQSAYLHDLDTARRRTAWNGCVGKELGSGRGDRRKNGDDGRSSRRLVYRIHTESGHRGLGGIRRRDNPQTHRGSSRASDLGRVFCKAVPSASISFPVPPGIVTRTIDPKTSQLATPACPDSFEETFIEGSEPTVFCELHNPSVIDRIKDLFGM